MHGLHVINGDSAAGSWKQAFEKSNVTGKLLHIENNLSCGPMVNVSTLEAWQDKRNSFFREISPDRPCLSFATDFIDYEKRICGDENIFVWIGTGAGEQLLLMLVVVLLDRAKISFKRLRVVQYEQITVNGNQFKTTRLGELAPEYMYKHPLARLLSNVEISYCRTAWLALTSNDPMKINDFQLLNSHPLAHVRDAMHIMFEKYPSKNTGLTFLDHQILLYVKKLGPNTARVIGGLIGELPINHYVSDDFLFHRMLCLASDKNPTPLLILRGSLDFVSLWETTVDITEFGHAVADGTRSSFPENPIDEWIGGVHIDSSKGNLWFLDGRMLKKANKPN